MLQKGGRSGARIVEDLLRFVPGIGHFALSPVEAARSSVAHAFCPIAHLNPSPVPIRTDSLSGDSSVVNLIYPDTYYHLQVHLIRGNYVQHSRSDSTPGSGSHSRNRITFDRLGGYDFHLRDYSRDEETWIETYSFECSETCSELEVKVHPPQLQSKDDLAGFAEEKIRMRYNAYTAGQEMCPPCPTPAMCFNVLYSILCRVLKEELKSISEEDSRLELFDVRLLTKVGFLYDKSSRCYVWPDLSSRSHTAQQKQKEKLCRWILELATRGIASQSSPSYSTAETSLARYTVPVFYERLVDGVTHLQRLLIGQADETRQQDAFPQLGEPSGGGVSSGMSYLSDTSEMDNKMYGCYVALGSTEYASDEILMRRYDLQVQNDSVNTPAYLEALDAISKQRRSEELQIKVVQVVSLEEDTNHQVEAAYGYFNVSKQDGADDDFFADSYRQIVKQFPFRISDAQQALRTIAADRDSDKLRNLLEEKAISSLDEALETLGLAPISSGETPDETAVRRAFDMHFDDPHSREALFIIAKARMSFPLLSLYEDVNAPMEMSLANAYGLLGIDRENENTTSGTDENLLLATFDVRLQDNPDSILELRRALSVIAQERGYQRILMFLTSGEIKDTVVDRTAPIGLRNIGNTCYLNSLLQYYYTIQPLREAAMEYALMGCDLGNMPDDSQERKIGGRLVSSVEIKRAGKFVALLAKLFYELGASEEMCATPSEELVTLAFGGDPDDLVEEIEVDVDEGETNESRASVPGSREATELGVGDSKIIIQNDKNGEEKQWLHKENADESSPSSAEPYMDDFKMLVDDQAYASPSPIITAEEIVEESAQTESQRQSPTPDPITTTGKKRKITRRKTFYSAQQDVTECISNVFFLLEAALGAEGIDKEDGEQLDLIKRLFYGKTSQTLETLGSSNKVRIKNEWFSSLLIDVAEGSRDIYDALDSCFSEDVVTLSDGETKRNVTISEAPEVLQIQIQRVQFDRETGSIFKSLAQLDFDQIIYMDRYLGHDSSLLNQRRQTAILRERLANLKRQCQELKSKKDTLAAARKAKEEELSKASGGGFSQVVLYNGAKVEAKSGEDDFGETPELSSKPSTESVSQTVDQCLIDIDPSPPRPDNDDGSSIVDTPSSSSDPTTELDQSEQMDVDQDEQREEESLTIDIEALQKQVEELQAEIDEPYKDMRKHGYRIHAVFIHRGDNVNYGHYWVYIYDPKLEAFRKYDDETVSIASCEAVFGPSSGADNATPYLLAFVREDKYYELTEAVHRTVSADDNNSEESSLFIS